MKMFTLLMTFLLLNSLSILVTFCHVVVAKQKKYLYDVKKMGRCWVNVLELGILYEVNVDKDSIFAV